MKENASLLGFILVATVATLTRAEYEELCVRFADGVQFREPGNCQAYVICKDGIGTIKQCPVGQVYDKNNKKCVSSLSDTYCNDRCKSKNDVWVADPASCSGFYYCRSGVGTHGHCYDGFNFNEKTQLCEYEVESECDTISDFCGILPNSVPFAHRSSCKQYHQCTSGNLKTLTCGTDLYYDVQSAKCITMHEVPCDAHPLPKNVCGTDSKPVYNIFKNDTVTCRGYYYCSYKGAALSDKNPAWYQCPEGTFFDDATQKCNDPTLVKCKNNRCEGRGNMVVVAEDWGCHHYYACQNGLVLEKRVCPRDMFFDEHRQACIYDEISYPVCDY